MKLELTKLTDEMWVAIKDGVDTYQRTGLLPSELEKQRDGMFAFIEWIGFNSTLLYFRDVDEKWLMTRLENFVNPSLKYEEFTTAELYEYWIKNVEK